jgi:hypothetical protein
MTVRPSGSETSAAACNGEIQKVSGTTPPNICSYARPCSITVTFWSFRRPVCGGSIEPAGWLNSAAVAG